MKHYRFHPEAANEYSEATFFYRRIDPELGRRFFEEIESLIRDVRLNPESIREFDPPVRRHFGSVFHYAVLYLVKADEVIIVAIMHMHRHPGYWKERV